jgi:hypothetical protein
MKTATFIFDTCSDIIRPYKAMLGPLALECKEIEITYKKEIGVKPEIVNRELKRSYTIINEHPLIYKQSYYSKRC